MKHTSRLLFLIGLLLSGQNLAATEFFSRYTSLEKPNCFAQQQHEEGTFWWCPAFSGYQVAIDEYADLSLKLVHHNQEYSIGHLIAEGTLGKQLEWRFIKKRQNFHEDVNLIAVIFRGTPSSSHPTTTASSLYVSKITPRETCLVAVVPPQANQNKVAQNVANNAQGKPCLSP